MRYNDTCEGEIPIGRQKRREKRTPKRRGISHYFFSRLHKERYPASSDKVAFGQIGHLAKESPSG